MFHYNTRWPVTAYSVIYILDTIYIDFPYTYTTCSTSLISIAYPYFCLLTRLVHMFNMESFLVTALAFSPNVYPYLSDWLEIPRASLHVTLGPTTQPAFTSFPGLYYLKLDSQYWLPAYSINYYCTFPITYGALSAPLYTKST